MLQYLRGKEIKTMVCFDCQRGTVVERLMEEIVMDKSHLLELIAVCECKTLCQDKNSL